MFIFQSLSDFSREKVPDELYVADDEEVAVWLDWQKLFLRPAGRGMRVIADGK